jgi:hypothetical protein
MKDWRRVCPETGHQSKGKKKKKKSATTDSGRIPFSFGRPRSLSSGGFFSFLRVSDATRLESIKIYRCRLFFFCLSTILNRFNYY